MTPAFDPRTTLARPDLAAQALEGLLAAERYEPVRSMTCLEPSALVRGGPADDAAAVDQVLFGERFDVLETREGWAWGQAARDGVVGWAPLEVFGEGAVLPTHRVDAINDVLPFNALVRVTAVIGQTAAVEGFGPFPMALLSEIGTFASGPAHVAERWLGTPWLEGGRTGAGIDGPGLVQQALFAYGRGCPRQPDLMAQRIGRSVPLGEVRRGDVILLAEHALIAVEADEVVHAAPGDQVRREPLHEALAGLKAQGFGEVLAARRP